MLTFVKVKNPLKQGLTLVCAIIYSTFTIVKVKNPLKQGLKHVIMPMTEKAMKTLK